jgi:hypothetical protein
VDKKILIKIDAIFFYMFSIASFLMSLIMLIAPSLGIFNGIIAELKISRGIAIAILVLMVLMYLVVALAYFFAARYLWKFKKTGGIIALVLLIMAFLGSWVFVFMGYFGLMVFLFEVMLLVFLILGWKKLS